MPLWYSLKECEFNMTPYTNLPYSHNGLKAFESVARFMSFTQAADELNVTQSAVSRQVKQLEQDLNTQLIERKHRSIELTIEGLQLFQALRESYLSLETLLSSWQEPKRKRIVIKATLSFATRILISKVRELNERYPEHEIVIIPSIEEDECLETPDYDLLIFHTRIRERYQGRSNMFFLRDEYMAPVCASNAGDVASILAMPRIHSTLDHHDWKVWLAEEKRETLHPVRNTTFFTLDLALSACLSGQGATVTDLLLILPELEREYFCCPEGVRVQNSAWQYLGHQRTHTPEINDLIEWLKLETEKELMQLKRLANKNSWSGVVSD